MNIVLTSIVLVRRKV